MLPTPTAVAQSIDVGNEWTPLFQRTLFTETGSQLLARLSPLFSVSAGIPSYDVSQFLPQYPPTSPVSYRSVCGCCLLCLLYSQHPGLHLLALVICSSSFSSLSAGP